VDRQIGQQSCTPEDWSGLMACCSGVCAAEHTQSLCGDFLFWCFCLSLCPVNAGLAIFSAF
jgi:hypothetical protein